MNIKRGVPYYRVSTARQGKSGLGLEAQQYAVHNYIKYNKMELGQEFVEIESRSNNNRPILNMALEYCRQNDGMLLVAKLDRLSGSMLFVVTLMESKVEFKAVNNPFAPKLLTHIEAAFSQEERERNSERTIDALAAAKRRGVILGRYGIEVLSKRNKQRAIDFAKLMAPIIKELQDQGYKTVRAITKRLNRKRVPTYRMVGKWHTTTVFNLLRKIKEAAETEKMIIINI